MRKIFIIFALLFFSISARASVHVEESTDKHFSLAKIESRIQSMFYHAKDSIQRGLLEAKSLGNETWASLQDKSLDTSPKKITTTVKEEFSWKNIKQRSSNIYQGSFLQREINGFVGFYKTTFEKVSLEKTRVSIQNFLGSIQSYIDSIVHKTKVFVDHKSEKNKAEK